MIGLDNTSECDEKLQCICIRTWAEGNLTFKFYWILMCNYWAMLDFNDAMYFARKLHGNDFFFFLCLRLVFKNLSFKFGWILMSNGWDMQRSLSFKYGLILMSNGWERLDFTGKRSSKVIFCFLLRLIGA